MARRAVAKDAEYQAVTANPPDLSIEAQWWRRGKDTVPTKPLLVACMNAIKQHQTQRYDNFRRLISIFEWGYKFSTTDNTYNGDCPLDESHLSYNAAQNILETVQAKICKNEIVPMALTNGGAMTDRENAKRLTQALAGEFQENAVAKIHEDVVMDALVGGTAFAVVFRSEGRVRVEHAPFEEFFVEESEGMHRAPRSLYRRKRMDRFVALAEYANPDDTSTDLVGSAAERAAAIMKCRSAELRGQSGFSAHNGQIDVYEGWHLPSRKPTKTDGKWEETDGRHQIAIDGRLICDEPYHRMYFPPVKYCPRPRRRSYWGLSGMYQLASGEREYEKMTLRVQKAHQKMGGTHIIAEKGSIHVGEFDNDQGTLIEYDQGRAPPASWNPEPVNPATYQYMESIPIRMQNNFGISQLSTSSQLPAGLQQASGKALQVFDDFEAERLLPYHKESERWHIEIGERIIDEIREILDESDEPYMARYKHQDWMDEIDWREVMRDQAEYRLDIEAANNLASKPAARFEQATEMLQDAAIDVAEFRRLMGMPDTQGALDLSTSDEDIILQNLMLMATQGKYNSPQPFDNLEMYLTLAGKFFNLSRLRGCSEKNLGLVMDAINEVRRLLGIAKQGSPPPAQPLMPPAPVVGAPPPLPALGQPPPAVANGVQ